MTENVKISWYFCWVLTPLTSSRSYASIDEWVKALLTNYFKLAYSFHNSPLTFFLLSQSFTAPCWQVLRVTQRRRGLWTKWKRTRICLKFFTSCRRLKKKTSFEWAPSLLIVYNYLKLQGVRFCGLINRKLFRQEYCFFSLWQNNFLCPLKFKPKC